MQVESLALPGLDGSNPLGFLAGIGLLQVLHDRVATQALASRLAWRNGGRWFAVVHGAPDLDTVLSTLVADLELTRRAFALTLAYDKDGYASNQSCVRDLKPQPTTLRTFQDQAAALCMLQDSGTARRRSVDLAAAYGSEVVKDNNGRVKPTALHFTAGQQAFLAMVQDLAEGLTREHFVEALVGPWMGNSKLPSLSWNASASRNYALRASNPASEKRGSVPGAEWLAFLALGSFSSFSSGGRLRTACVRGGWKDGVFTWPLWGRALTLPVVRSLLHLPGIDRLSQPARVAVGIETVLRSSILRSDQGGYGSFTPPLVV